MATNEYITTNEYRTKSIFDFKILSEQTDEHWNQVK